jgi:ubiquinone/menaquinone biosynthesis C-methylase UbiE
MTDDNLRTSEPFTAVAPHYDLLMRDVPYAEWCQYLTRLWTKHSCLPTTLLDLACGTGTLSIMLARNGHQVTGVDISGAMLEQAKRKSRAAGLYISFLEQDLCELTVESAAYDGAICLFDSINNITAHDLLQSTFQRVADSLGPAGAGFIFDMNTEFAFREHMFDQESTDPHSPLHYQWRGEYNEQTRICEVTMDFEYTRHGMKKPFREVHRQRAYAIDDVTEMLSKAGFAQTYCYRSYTLRKPGPYSDRVHFVALT